MNSCSGIIVRIRRLAEIAALGVKESGVPAVAELADAIIKAGIEQEASDIHIEPTAEALKVRYRIGGALIALYEPFGREIQSVLISRFKVMARMDSGDRLRPSDGHITYIYAKREIDIRVAALPSVYGEILSLRIMDRAGMLTKIEELSFSPVNERLFRRLVHLPAGLIIAAGPMNSGKSTALYAALRDMDTDGQVIMTVEDPAECLLDGVNQINVNPKVGLTFEAGLRAILRMDADILMVGEIRDEATARLAVRAALTGHLLLTSLHARDSLTAMLRLNEMGISRYFLAATLSGVLAQRLVRRLCPRCREEYAASAAELELLHDHKVTVPTAVLYRGRGCDFCHGTGFRGRVAVQEILRVDENIRQHILQGTPLNRLRADLVARNFCDMWQDGLTKAVQGLTTVNEVRRVLDA